MKKIFCLMILIAVLTVCGCGTEKNPPQPPTMTTNEPEKPPSNPQPKPQAKPQPKPSSAQKNEYKILDLSFNSTGGHGLSVSSGSIDGGPGGISTSISNGHAQISLQLPADFDLWGNFNVSNGQLSVQILNGQSTLVDKIFSGAQDERFDLAAGHYTLNIGDLRNASGKIVLRLVRKNTL